MKVAERIATAHYPKPKHEGLSATGTVLLTPRRTKAAVSPKLAFTLAYVVPIVRVVAPCVGYRIGSYCNLR